MAGKPLKRNPEVQLSVPQTSLLKKITPNTNYQQVSDNKKTQQALIDRGLASTDKSGTKIKPTAKGRKVAKKL